MLAKRKSGFLALPGILLAASVVTGGSFVAMEMMNPGEIEHRRALCFGYTREACSMDARCDWGNNGCRTKDGNVTTTTCGDGMTNPPEEDCDDGNLINDDGCSNTCKEPQEPRCGDGIHQPDAQEQCDDSNEIAGDDCDRCMLTTNVVCSALGTPEQCDMQNPQCIWSWNVNEQGEIYEECVQDCSAAHNMIRCINNDCSWIPDEGRCTRLPSDEIELPIDVCPLVLDAAACGGNVQCFWDAQNGCLPRGCNAVTQEVCHQLPYCSWDGPDQTCAFDPCDTFTDAPRCATNGCTWRDGQCSDPTIFRPVPVVAPLPEAVLPAANGMGDIVPADGLFWDEVWDWWMN
jgi:cysteine-rich repeat protein